MNVFVFKDSKSGNIWAISSLKESEDKKWYNTQYVGSSKQSLVTVSIKNGEEMNRVVIGDEYIQISGYDPITEVNRNLWSDIYVVQGNQVVPKVVAEKREQMTYNQAIEGLGLQMVLEQLMENNQMCGFSKEIEEKIEKNIQLDEYRKKFEEESKTKVTILESIRPEKIDFTNNEQLSGICNRLIKQIEECKDACEKQGKEVSTEAYTQIVEETEVKEEKAKQIAEELKSLANELGIDPKELLR